mgnify:CR=1 FL=1
MEPAMRTKGEAQNYKAVLGGSRLTVAGEGQKDDARWFRARSDQVASAICLLMRHKVKKNKGLL